MQASKSRRRSPRCSARSSDAVGRRALQRARLHRDRRTDSEPAGRSAGRSRQVGARVVPGRAESRRVAPGRAESCPVVPSRARSCRVGQRDARLVLSGHRLQVDRPDLTRTTGFGPHEGRRDHSGRQLLDHGRFAGVQTATRDPDPVPHRKTSPAASGGQIDRGHRGSNIWFGARSGARCRLRVRPGWWVNGLSLARRQSGCTLLGPWLRCTARTRCYIGPSIEASVMASPSYR